jgi:hypothetical protein
MTALTDIGELSISDSREGGKDYLLRPSFEAMTRIGTPEEIVQAYATIHGNDVAQLIEVCAGALGRFPEWLSPSFNRAAEKLLSTCMLVLQACCDDDLTPMIGEWKGGGTASYTARARCRRTTSSCWRSTSCSTVSSESQGSPAAAPRNRRENERI